MTAGSSDGPSGVIGWRRYLHRHPEQGFLEYNTAARVAARLEQLGAEVLTGEAAMRAEAMMGVPAREEIEAARRRALDLGADTAWVERLGDGQTAVVGVFKGARPGPCRAFRFDMDALPVTETDAAHHLPNEEGFASAHPGNMHACGHDGHTAIGLALAEAIDAERLAGTVKLVFQPAEEGLRGGRAVAESGVLDDVDEIFCLHLGMGVPSGTVHVAMGGGLASTKMRVAFHGRPAHAAMAPQEGRNALLAAAHAVTMIHALPTYHGPGALVNVGTFVAGAATNVVAAEAEIRVETRAPTMEANSGLEQAVRAAVASVAPVFGVETEIELLGSAPHVVCDWDLMERCRRKFAGRPDVEVAEGPLEDRGSEDASWLIRRVAERGGRGTYIIVGADLRAGHHMDDFDFDEASLPLAVDLLTQLLDD